MTKKELKDKISYTVAKIETNEDFLLQMKGRLVELQTISQEIENRVANQKAELIELQKQLKP